jgi:hypothetical protein
MMFRREDDMEVVCVVKAVEMGCCCVFVSNGRGLPGGVCKVGLVDSECAETGIELGRM